MTAVHIAKLVHAGEQYDRCVGALAAAAFLHADDAKRALAKAAGVRLDELECDPRLPLESAAALHQARAWQSVALGDPAAATRELCRAQDLDPSWSLPADWAGTQVAMVYEGACLAVPAPDPPDSQATWATAGLHAVGGAAMLAGAVVRRQGLAYHDAYAALDEDGDGWIDPENETEANRQWKRIQSRKVTSNTLFGAGVVFHLTGSGVTLRHLRRWSRADDEQQPEER